MYRMTGIVMRGLGKGKKLGFPTANLGKVVPSCELPPGVYSARVIIDHNNAKKTAKCEAAVIVGARLQKPVLVEVHIFDLDKNIYGSNLYVEVYKKVSDIVKTKTQKELKEKIQQDLNKIKKLLK